MRVERERERDKREDVSLSNLGCVHRLFVPVLQLQEEVLLVLSSVLSRS